MPDLEGALRNEDDIARHQAKASQIGFATAVRQIGLYVHGHTLFDAAAPHPLRTAGWSDNTAGSNEARRK